MTVVSLAAADLESGAKLEGLPMPTQIRLNSMVRFSCVGVGDRVVLVQVERCNDNLLQRSGRSERGMREGLVLAYDSVGGEWSRAVDLPEGIDVPRLCERGMLIGEREQDLVLVVRVVLEANKNYVCNVT
ncbi:hypothetical protein SLE2022_025330 [Rubroshorea leprosula]